MREYVFQHVCLLVNYNDVFFILYLQPLYTKLKVLFIVAPLRDLSDGQVRRANKERKDLR